MTTAQRNRALTAAFVNSVKKPGKYHDGKGTGLFLLVKPTGGRFWVQRITIRRKRCELGLGSPPTVTLAEAREQATENKRLLRSGGDPLAEKQRAKQVLSFAEAAKRTHAELSPTWKNPKDRAAFLSTLEKYIFPRFGNTPLPEVSSADVRQAILVARERVPGVAKKLIYRVSFVFKWGIAEGMCDNNPATTDALALPRDTHQAAHRKALPYAEVADCIASVKASNAYDATKLALEFLILTASRSGEVRGATWDEINFGTAEWIVPAERMKAKREHRIPLSNQAIDVLESARNLSNTGLVFGGTKAGKPMSDMTLSKLIKVLGYDADVHGFRTSFRTWAQEQTNFSREVAEVALAHKTQNKVEAAYARSDLFEKRRMMMDAWAGFLALGASAKVVTLNG